MFMVKSLLVLALVTTQLLAGGGGALYLCISSDGSHWCVETDPASCTCCRQVEGQQDERSSTCCSRAAELCDQTRDEHGTRGVESPELAGQPCGCTHILISHQQQAPPDFRARSATDAERLVRQVDLAPCVLRLDRFPSASLDWVLRKDPPPIPAQSLTILSSVVLLC